LFLNSRDLILIKRVVQPPERDEDADIVVVHPEDINKLIEMLNEAHDEWLLDQAEKDGTFPPTSPPTLRSV
jgi:hypothetical protein